MLALHARISEELGVTMPELDLGGGFGIAYTTQDDPSDPAQLATEMSKIVEHECRALGIDQPRLSIEPGRAIVGPSICTVYTVGTVKPVTLDGGAVRTYVSVDGGMSDNIRTALYDADYSCTLANRHSDDAPVLARVVGKHCEAGDIVVKDEFLPGDVAPGDLLAVPGTGAYCRSMASNYNHALRPPVIAVRDGVARVIVRRETEDDLLATDVGDDRWLTAAARGRARLRLGRLAGGAAAPRAGRDLAARVGAPVELAGVAVRRIDAPARGRRARRAADHRRRRPGHPRRRRPRGRGDRRHRAGPLADPRRARERRQRRHRQQGAARRGRPDPVRGRREGRPRPLLRGRRRRRDPDPPAAARVAGRRPGHPGARHRQRHHQLHPRQDGHRRAPASPRRSRRPRSSGYAEADPTADVEGFDAAAKAAILASLAFHTRVTAADVHREGISDVTAADVQSARDMGCVVKLLAIAELRTATGGEAVACACTRR